MTGFRAENKGFDTQNPTFRGWDSAFKSCLWFVLWLVLEVLDVFRDAAAPYIQGIFGSYIHEFRPCVVAMAERMLITVWIIIFQVSLFFIAFVFYVKV